MVGSNWQSNEKGSPQGGVISPLLANIYLDEFDQEMKRRQHRIVRYADDILILCCSDSFVNWKILGIIDRMSRIRDPYVRFCE